jgi:excisionase family DNA binding protein
MLCSSQFAAEWRTAVPETSYSDKQALAVRETIAAASIGRTKLYELLNDGTLKSVKVGRKRLILRSSLDALLTPAAA